MTASTAGTPPATGLAATAAADLARAAVRIKQPVAAFAEAFPRNPEADLVRAMDIAARYLLDQGTDHEHLMAWALADFARRLLGEEEDR